MTTAVAVAEAFFSAIETGDLTSVEALYAPDAVIWHNTDGLNQSAAENLRVLKWMIRAIPSRQYRVLRREPLPDGFFQQHVLELQTPLGRYALPACIIVRLRGAQIIRLDEYLDSAHVSAMRATLGL
jgi:ketosteroid isomerase-like protein